LSQAKEGCPSDNIPLSQLCGSETEERQEKNPISLSRRFFGKKKQEKNAEGRATGASQNHLQIRAAG